MPHKNENCRIKIEDIGNDGEGIGRINGVAVFVEGGIPGDLLEVLIVKEKKSYCYGKLLKIITPSDTRCKPICPAFGCCGGCSLQHIFYPSQLEYKYNKVKNALKRIGGIDIPVNQIIGMDTPYFYRNKAQFPFGGVTGAVKIGFFGKRSHSIVPVTNCFIQGKAFKDILESVECFANEFNIPPYDESTHTGLLRHVLLRANHDSSEVMVCLIINGQNLPYEDELISKLSNFESIKSILLHPNTNRTNVILANDAITGKVLFGNSFITDRIGQIEYQISSRSFFQVNPIQTKILYDKVLEFADFKKTDTVFDIYCGVGTISLYIAEYCKKVYGIEAIPEAVADARSNAIRNNISNVEFIPGEAENIIPELILSHTLTPDVIIVDPPRKGCDKRLLDALIVSNSPKIIYVSCDPATLARDLKLLTASGYCVIAVQPVDCFPQTSHVESVVLLKKTLSTSLSKENYETYEIYDLNKACQFILKNFSIRRMGEELIKLLNKKGLDISVLKKEFEGKHINKWLSGERKISRESAVKILSLLNITNISEAEEFLKQSCWVDGFYARDYKDLIYMFCLKNSLGISTMMKYIDKYKHLDKYNPDAEEINKKNNLSSVLEYKFHALKKEAELEEYFDEYEDSFGSFNRTAYKEFMNHYDLAVMLLNELKSGYDRTRYSHANVSLKEFCENLKIVQNKEYSKPGLIYEILEKHELNTQKLTNIKYKKDKVPRKYLILLFMFTFGDLEDHMESIKSLDEILDKCGMPNLDSRNPFDWIVMNSYYASSKSDIGAFDRMKELVSKIYDIEMEDV